MEPFLEGEELHAHLQKNHIVFVNMELNLIAARLEMSRAEYAVGFVDAGAQNLRHVRQAIANTSSDLTRIESEGQRVVFELRLRDLTTAIRNFEIPE